MRRLFILRPEPAARASIGKARQLGLDVVHMPLFEIQPVAWQAPEAAGFDALLLTSASAALYGGDELQKLRGLPVHAVGDATAAAARDAGFDIATTGSAGVDRLLGSLEPDLKLLHLCGEHRHEPEAPRQKIESIIVYRALEASPGAELKSLPGNAAVVHSARAAQRLALIVDDCGLSRTEIRLACISKVAAEAAGAGWECTQIAEKPSDDALLVLAASLCDKPTPNEHDTSG